MSLSLWDGLLILAKPMRKSMSKLILSILLVIFALSVPSAVASGGHGSVTEFQHRLVTFHVEEAAKGLSGRSA